MDSKLQARYKRWFLDIEKRYRDLKFARSRVEDKDYMLTTLRHEEALSQMAEIEESVAAGTFAYEDFGIDKYRFRSVNNKVLAIDLGIVYKILSSVPRASMMRRNPVLLKAAFRYWRVSKSYFAGTGVTPGMAGIRISEYYRVLIKVDRATLGKER
jgi:hypothetical protein